MRKLGFFVFGATVGSLIGAAVAILFAPSSGQQLRDNLRSSTLQAVDDVKQAAIQKREELEQQLANLRSGDLLKLE